jgi:transposase InsO family protein
METHREEFPIERMAELLGVSRSGYYKHKKSKSEKAVNPDSELLLLIKDIWKRNRKTYGVRRILKEVKKIDPTCGKRKVKKMMKILGIKGKQEKKFKIATTDSSHNESIAPDLLGREFKQEEKDKAWVSDVTFLKSLAGWMYLCVIIDLYSRKVVGWTLSDHNDSKLVTDTITKAILNRNPGKGLIFHSDRGSNYCSKEVRELLANNKIRRSNSRKGNCWDNAVAESFFGSLKRELEYNVFGSIEEAREILFDHIEVFYNRQRLHSFLNYQSPQEFEDKKAA